MKKSVKILLTFLIAICCIAVISNAAETYESGIFKGEYSSDGTVAYIDSITDTTITELEIPSQINGKDVSIRYTNAFKDLSNLKKITSEKLSNLTTLDYQYTPAIEEIVVKQEKFSGTYGENTFTNLDKSVKICGYAGTRLAVAMQEVGYTFESIGNSDEIFNYDSNGNILGLNISGLEEITVPSGIEEVRFANIHGINANTTVDDFGLDTIKKVTFLTKDVIEVYDLGYMTNLEEIVGYTGNGIENLASSKKFTSLGNVENPVDLFKYEVVDNEYIKITGLNKQYPDPLEIPSEIDGLPVKEIGSFMPYYDWYRIKMLDKLIIPETVTKIASGSFMYLYINNVYIYSKNIEFDESLLYFNWKGYTGLTSGTKVYAYDESGLEDVIKASSYSGTYISLNETSTTSVEYTTHVQNIGWQDYVSDGEMAGTSGQSLRLEGIKIKVNAPVEGGISYSTHIQNIGWQDFVSDDNLSGTSGQGLRLEAIKIKLTGKLEENYDIYYRVHAQNVGLLDWAKNGEESGTAGYGYRLEGIEIKLVEKDAAAPGETDKSFIIKAPTIEYTTHVQNVGWQDYVANGEMAGTEGLGLRLEGIKIRLDGQAVSGNIEYSTHIQNIGWQDYVANDEMSGTSGQSLRLEAIKIELTDELYENFDIYYRVHAQNAGWLGWAKNGEEAGTAGYGFRLEGIEIKIVEKGAEAPGDTNNAYVENIQQ